MKVKPGILASLGVVLVLILAISLQALTPSQKSEVEAIPVQFPRVYPFPNHIEFSLFENDSLADMTIARLGEKWDTTQVSYSFEVFPIDLSCMHIIWDSLLYAQQWDTLSQPSFWRKVMNMRRDSALVNIAQSREALDVISLRSWDKKTEGMKQFYKDSLIAVNNLASTSQIYITPGKSHYYDFSKVLPKIGRALHIFKNMSVDPWYAQAILLIESPAALQYSPVGAYGSFQLMKSVAKEYGLVVNDSIDEREDLNKSARAAANLIGRRCLPQTRWMLRKRNIPFSENELWFRLLVLHSYHAGAGNVDGVLEKIAPSRGGMSLMKKVWRTEYKGFKNASQNYSQVALASFLELDLLMASLPDTVCQDTLFYNPSPRSREENIAQKAADSLSKAPLPLNIEFEADSLLFTDPE
ncbi:MAG: transglycosylase SLT domain-containing protein [Bacteroidota bacterium]